MFPSTLIRYLLGLLWRSSGYDSKLSLLRAQVQSLVRELRSLKLQWPKKKNKGSLANLGGAC